MMLSLKWFVFVLLICSSNMFAQYYEAIEENAANYFLSLANNNPISEIEFEKLKIALYSGIDKKELEKTYQVSKHELDSLKTHFNEYESSIKSVSSDSAIVLLNQWYLHFSNTFYNYADEKFFSSNKTKILFFSVSMSCQCTLEMCKKQTVEILNLAKEKGLDYWIVDSYEHNDLQIKYETLFSPSLIVFDRKNEVLDKIEYQENLIEELTDYLDKNIYKNSKRN